MLKAFLPAFLAITLLPALAQTNGTPAAPPENRYLLVVETSGSMLRRHPGTLNALGGLLASGFSGQAHPGDTLGLWTFSDGLYTGHFPLQHWGPRARTDVTDRVLTFLNELKYEKQSSFDKLLPALDRLVKDSPYITIVLVSDGEDKIHGTPFDARINGAFHTWRERQRAANMPFITVLRAKHGVITDCTVTSAPWPVEMPPLPPELHLAPLASLPSRPAAPPSPTVPPLIIHGKKPELLPTAPAAAAPEAPHPAAAPLAETNAAAQLPALPDATSNSVAPAQAAAVPATNLPPSLSPPPPAASASPHKAFAPPPAAAAPRKGLWLGAALLVAAFLGLALLLFLRARPDSGSSLITQSLERQTKNE